MQYSRHDKMVRVDKQADIYKLMNNLELSTDTYISKDDAAEVDGAQPCVVRDAHEGVFLQLTQAIQQLLRRVPDVGKSR